MEWVGRVDDEALGLVPDCSVIQAEMAVLLLRRSWRALCQRRVNIRVVLQQPDTTIMDCLLKVVHAGWLAKLVSY